MAYVVLARKWRPAQFADIVGQGHIVRTLMNAIRAERIHQAYLLTGSRGIGKTSITRIFAKALRCEHSAWSNSWLTSCDACPSCKEIASGTSVDVIEIDGASNNGVDAVREIRENAKYLPSSGSKKIYIIDEVHMLTTAAFNALLKTLEEPPAHVVFMFATTEPHKIPATILSRCQRFDLRRVTMAQIQARLAEVMRSEGTEIEVGALALIARAAEGSMRDALSLLDQVIAFAGNKITTQAVRDSIGLIEGQTLLGILRGVFDRKPMAALALIDQAYQQGHDLRVLTRSLIELIHGAVLAKLGNTGSDLLELPEDERHELIEIAGLRSLEEIELIFQVLHYGMDWIARSPRPKLVLDVLLVKCATADALVQLSSLKTTTAQPAASAPVKVVSPQVPARTSAPQTQAVSTGVAPMAAAAPAAPVAAVQSSGPASWEGFISHVREKRPLLASLLEHGTCTELPMQSAESQLLICYPPGEAYFRDQLQARVYSEQLAILSKEYFKQSVRVRVELKESGESMAARREREQAEREQTARQAAQNHPMIAEAKALFGGDLGPVELIHPAEDGGSDENS